VARAQIHEVPARWLRGITSTNSRLFIQVAAVSGNTFSLYLLAIITDILLQNYAPRGMITLAVEVSRISKN
jgi:hypothetical protein